jgi:rod shape-determining protein MreC
MKFYKNKLTVAISILSVGFLVLIGYSVNREKPSVFEGGVGNIFNNVQKVVYSAGDGVKDFFDIVVNFKEVKEEYAAMEKRNSELEQKAKDYDNLKISYDDMSKMFEYKTTHDQYDYVGANIINRSGNGMIELFTIDKGSDHGVAKDNVIITHRGLVGKVSEVYSDHSIVQPCGNGELNVRAMIENSAKDNGLIKGYKNKNGNRLLKMDSLPIDADIDIEKVKNKEKVYTITTSEGSRYPKGITIGTVIDVEVDKVKSEKIALVQPAVDIDKLEVLYILIPKGNK